MRQLLFALGFTLLISAALVLLVFSDTSCALSLATSLGFPGFVLLAIDDILASPAAPIEGENWMRDNFRRTGDPCNFGLTSGWMTAHWDD